MYFQIKECCEKAEVVGKRSGGGAAAKPVEAKPAPKAVAKPPPAKKVKFYFIIFTDSTSGNTFYDFTFFLQSFMVYTARFTLFTRWNNNLNFSKFLLLCLCLHAIFILLFVFVYYRQNPNLRLHLQLLR